MLEGQDQPIYTTNVCYGESSASVCSTGHVLNYIASCKIDHHDRMIEKLYDVWDIKL